MQPIMSPEIHVSDSMRSNIQEAVDKMREVTCEDVSPNFMISKIQGGGFCVKIFLHYHGDDYFAQEEGYDFKKVLIKTKRKMLRLLSNHKEQVLSRRRRSGTDKSA